MMTQLLVTIGIIFVLFLGWVLVQHVTRVYSARHPELGPHREDGGCGDPDRDCSGCSLLTESCTTGVGREAGDSP